MTVDLPESLARRYDANPTPCWVWNPSAFSHN